MRLNMHGETVMSMLESVSTTGCLMYLLKRKQTRSPVRMMHMSPQIPKYWNWAQVNRPMILQGTAMRGMESVNMTEVLNG